MAELEQAADAWSVERPEMDRTAMYSLADYSLKAREASGAAYRRAPRGANA